MSAPNSKGLQSTGELADKVAYMPSDTMSNAKKLIKNFNIKAAFFVKYDFWFNYMKVLKNNNNN